MTNALSGQAVTANGNGTSSFSFISSLQSGTNAIFSIDGYGMMLASTSVAITGGTTTLTPSQYICPYIALTGTLLSSSTIVLPSNLPANVVRQWYFDVSALTLGIFSLSFMQGLGTSNAISTIATTSQVIQVYVPQNNSVVINA